MKETRKQRKARRAAERVDIGALTEHGRYVINSIRRDRKRREKMIDELERSIPNYIPMGSAPWDAIDEAERRLFSAPVPQPQTVYKDITCIGDDFRRKMIVLV